MAQLSRTARTIRRRRSFVTATVIGLIGLFLIPGSASAAGTCTQAGAVLTVTITGGSSTLDVTGAGLIRMDGAQCDGTADVNNTDTINVTGSGGDDTLTIDIGNAFVPGDTAEGSGDSEIEFSVNMGAGTDSLVVTGDGSTFDSPPYSDPAR